MLLTLILLVIGGGNLWAQDETIDLSAQGYENGTQYTETKGTDCTITYGGGGNTGKYYDTGKGIRIYGGGSFTVSSTTKKITNLTLTFSESSYSPSSADVANNGTLTVGSNVQTWKSSDAAGVASVAFTRPSGKGHWRLQKVSVTYSTAEAGKTITKISFANGNLTVEQNGSVDSYTNVATVKDDKGNTIQGATVTYSSDNTKATVDANGKVTFDNKTTGTYKITANYAGDDTNSPASASYTITVTPKTTGAGTEANPYTVADLIALNDASQLPISEVYVKGKISKVIKFYDTYGEIDYNVSDDGTERNEIEIYNGSGLNKAKFTALTDLEKGWTVTVKGIPTMFKTTLEMGRGNYITSIDKTTSNINSAVIDNTQRGIRYNLNGQRVSNSYKGVVIENGKKLIVK